MNLNSYKKSIILLFIKTLIIVLLSVNSVMADSVRDRFRTCTPRGGEGKKEDNVIIEGLDINMSNGGKDVNFELDNPVCAVLIATSYAAVKLAIANMNRVCGSGSSTPRVAPSLMMDAVDIVKAGLNAKNNPGCITTIGIATGALSSLMSEILVIYGVAKGVYDNTRLCGSNWHRWNAEDMLKNLSGPAQDYIISWMKNPNNIKPGTTQQDLMNIQQYREWYFNGKEYEDTGSNACKDVTKPDSNGKYPEKQKYYMRGSMTGNFNCEKYNPKMLVKQSGDSNYAQRHKDYQDAYNCCLQKSRTTVCIEYMNFVTQNASHKFCAGGTKCEIEQVTFAADYKFDNRLICARSWSLCPYNFNVGGGTTECDYFQDGYNGKFVTTQDVESGDCSGKSEVRDGNCQYNKKAGKCRNYCQLLENCVIANSVYMYESNISSPYFSHACIDFVGDSKNNLGYDTGIFAGNKMNFTAPISQCVRETLENVFYNRAGHSKCLLSSEAADHKDVCASGQYLYKKGEKVMTTSFFETFQNSAKTIVKMILTLMVTIIGMKTLLGGQPLKKTEMIMLTVKISIVIFFAFGNAWQSTFFEGVYRGSGVISELIMKIKIDPSEDRRDGCQFGDMVVASATDNASYQKQSFGSAYDPDKKYLAIWDTFDCKIARYLGFGPKATEANIAKLVFAGFLTWPVGIYFAVLLLIFGFYMIAVALRALHIFVLSAISIIIMVYISTITIPACLFKKTENIFKSWLTNLLAFSLQPIILFAYIGLFISVFDSIVLGSATFTGSAPFKEIICDAKCYDNNNNLVTLKVDKTPIVNVEKDCEENLGRKILNPNNDSIACIIGIDNIVNWPGLELFGISVPIIEDLFTSGGRDKILTLLKAALVIYILAQFLDQIPSIAGFLVGKGLPPVASMAGANPLKMAAYVRSAASALQKRGSRGAKKRASITADDAKEIMKSIGTGKKEISRPQPDNKSKNNNNDIAGGS